MHELAGKMADHVLAAIDRPLRRIAERIEALEKIPLPRDGRDGERGRDGSTGANGADGKDGKDGVAGRDGLGFDDLDVVYDGERSFVFRFSRGERVREFSFKLPVMIYRGVFHDGAAYERGDTVTFGGSLWHCNGETAEKPDEATEIWTRAVRRGRDGKNGKDGEKGEPGPEGRAGRDLTQMAPDGSKW